MSEKFNTRDWSVHVISALSESLWLQPWRCSSVFKTHWLNWRGHRQRAEPPGWVMTVCVNLIRPFPHGGWSYPCRKCDYTSPQEVRCRRTWRGRDPGSSLRPQFVCCLLPTGGVDRRGLSRSSCGGGISGSECDPMMTQWRVVRMTPCVPASSSQLKNRVKNCVCRSERLFVCSRAHGYGTK